MAFEKKIKCSRSKLKHELINRLVDSEGRKVSKYSLKKDKEFLKAIEFDGKTLSSGTISNYCRILENVEPKGIINEEFLYEYHKHVTGRIPEEIDFIEFSKNKKKGGKGFRSERALLLAILEGELDEDLVPSFLGDKNEIIEEFLNCFYTKEAIEELRIKYDKQMR